MKRIIVMLMALVAIAAGVKAQAIPDGVYWIKFAGKPEFMLTVFSERTSFSNAGMKNVVKLGKEKNDVSQQWKVTNNADGTIEIRSMKDADYAICPPDAKNLKDREQIYAGKKAAGTCGLWVPERLGNGSFVLLVAQNRNFCLNLRNGNQAVSEKGIVDVYSTHKGYEEQWTFENINGTPLPAPTSPATPTTPTTPATPTTPTSTLQPSSDGYYHISSANDWAEFAKVVQSKPKANAKLTKDVNLGNSQVMIGAVSNPYQGTFDGQGHTLTVNISNSEPIVGPFRAIKNANIKNLHVAGKVTTGNCVVGGIAGIAVEGSTKCTFSNCWVSATLSSGTIPPTIDTIGGFVGTTFGEAVFEDCLFSGMFDEKNKYCNGGFVGHCPGTATVKNCLNIGSYKWEEMDNYTFIRRSNPKISKSFYLNVLGVAQGKKVTKEQLNNGSVAKALQAKRSTVIWVQDKSRNYPMLKIFATEGSTTPSSPATSSQNRRFDVKAGTIVVKLKQQGRTYIQTTYFDNYGEWYRVESRQNNQLVQILIVQGKTQYDLNPRNKTGKIDRNFTPYNFNDNSTITKLNLTKKGTSSVLDKACTVYANANVEYHVWKGIALRQIFKSGTTVEATSFKQAESVSRSTFKVPKGYVFE